MGKRTVTELEHRLSLPALDAAFDDAEVTDLPEPVARYFRAAIAPGTPLARSARLTMTGHIHLGTRWVPFRAREVLAPTEGFVWSARAGGVIVGSDHYVDGQGALDWRLLGLIRVAHGDGPDVSRSAIGRCAGEAVWLPTAMLPRFGARWSAVDDHHLRVGFPVRDTEVDMDVEVDDRGRLVAVSYERWGDPEASGAFAAHRFGLVVTDHATFGGLTLPSAGRVGWHIGSERWSSGEFFRYRLTAVEPTPAPGDGTR